tara:strand:+ start:2710 stop:3930 length:1221 start_codon:yes stop_codon:yes gene_type:complete
MTCERLNVLVFASTFPRWEDDPVTARFVYDLAMELTRHFNTFVLTPHTPGSNRLEEWNGLKVIRFPYFYPLESQALVNGTGMMSCMRKNKLSVLQVPSFLYFQMKALKKIVRDYRIDVVNSHWMIPQGFIAALTKRSLGFKHILTIHAAGLFALRRMPFGRAMGKVIIQNCDALYSVSSYNHAMLSDLIQRESPVNILPMGIHTKFFQPGEGLDAARRKLNLEAKQHILYVGKLSEKKGVKYLLEAFALLKEEFSAIKLVIVGGGLLEDSLKNQAKALKIIDRVWFAGFQSKNKIKTFFQACDLAVIPSIIDSTGETEGLPVVLLEALASGKPVVATAVGGMPDLIREGENGFLAPQKNAEALALKMKLALRADLKILGRNAMNSVLRYDWKKIGEDYRDTILKIT